MRPRFRKHLLAGAGLATLFALPAYAQHPLFRSSRHCPPAPCPTGLPPVITPDRPLTPSEIPTTPAVETALPPERSFVAAGEVISVADSSVGYIDSALIDNQFRLRFDAAYDNVRPDRAEFFYGKCGCFGGDAPGPRLPERSVDYQDVSAYFEVVLAPRIATFVEVPVRFLDPEVNENTTGLADLNAGVKFVFLQTPDTVGTFQVRGYAPTGDADRGLGTDHASVEPGLLVWHQLAERLALEGELRLWIPIEGTKDFEGEVMRYGIGAGYDVVRNHCFHVTPIVELVGWTVLDGQALAVTPDGTTLIEDAEGDTIVNLKAGIRMGDCKKDVYFGYGRALTGDTWYEDVFRMEFRWFF